MSRGFWRNNVIEGNFIVGFKRSENGVFYNKVFKLCGLFFLWFFKYYVLNFNWIYFNI